LALAPPTLLGRASRHCHGIITLSTLPWVEGIVGNYFHCPSQRMKMSAKRPLKFHTIALLDLTVSAEIARGSNDLALRVKPRGGKKQGPISGEGGPCLFLQPEPNG
jgi:hypothetical protein